MTDAKSYFPEIKLRLPEDLKRQIEKAASAGKRSMNAEVNLRLETTFRADDAGEAREALTTDPLVGLFGHTWDRAEGGRHRIRYQFEVRAALGGGVYLVQLFEWFMGEETNLALMNLATKEVDDQKFDRITFETCKENWHYRAERANRRDDLEERRKAKEGTA